MFRAAERAYVLLRDLPLATGLHLVPAAVLPGHAPWSDPSLGQCGVQWDGGLRCLVTIGADEVSLNVVDVPIRIALDVDAGFAALLGSEGE